MHDVYVAFDFHRDNRRHDCMNNKIIFWRPHTQANQLIFYAIWSAVNIYIYIYIYIYVLWRSYVYDTATFHDDVILRKYFLRYWPFVRGIYRSPVDYPYKGRWFGASMCFFDVHLNKRLSKQSICRWFRTHRRSLWFLIKLYRLDIWIYVNWINDWTIITNMSNHLTRL